MGIIFFFFFYILTAFSLFEVKCGKKKRQKSILLNLIVRVKEICLEAFVVITVQIFLLLQDGNILQVDEHK